MQHTHHVCSGSCRSLGYSQPASSDQTATSPLHHTILPAILLIMMKCCTLPRMTSERQTETERHSLSVCVCGEGPCVDATKCKQWESTCDDGRKLWECDLCKNSLIKYNTTPSNKSFMNPKNFNFSIVVSDFSERRTRIRRTKNAILIQVDFKNVFCEVPHPQQFHPTGDRSRRAVVGTLSLKQTHTQNPIKPFVIVSLGRAAVVC